MPVLTFLAFVGFALVALLFVADATLERDSPVIISSDRVGLPPPWHTGTTQILTAPPAPAPDMTSQAVPAAQPRSKPPALGKIGAAASAARAEAPPNNNSRPWPADDRQSRLVDRFSIKGQ
jgi:hypothetical protein